MNHQIREMRADDFPKLWSLWHATGIVPPVHSEPALAGLLQSNRGLSVVAVRGNQLIAAVLCVQDGSTGCTNRLAVDPALTDTNLADTLLGKILAKMASRGIHRFRVHEEPGASESLVWQSLQWINPITSKISKG